MRMLACITVLITSLFASAPDTRAGEGIDVEKEAVKQVLQIEKDWGKALIEADVAWFEKTIDDQWKMVLPNGQTKDKQSFIEPFKSGEMTVNSCEITDMDVRVYGSTAVAIGLATIKGKNLAGRFGHVERWTDVYVKKDGGWSCVTAQLAVVPDPASDKQQASREEFEEYCRMWQGRWVGDVTWVADWSGFGKKGDKVTGYLEATIVEGENIMSTRFFGGAGSGTGMMVYDARAKKIRSMWANSGGGMSQVIAFKQDGQWIETGVGSLADGTRTSFTSRLTVSDDGKTHTWTGSGMVGDEKTDDQRDVWRRVSE